MDHSLAGTLACLVATQNLNTFDYVIMQSPLVDESVIHAAENLDLNDDLEIYHTIGLNETEVNTTVEDRKSTRLNSSHVAISYAVFCLKKKTLLKTYSSFK